MRGITCVKGKGGGKGVILEWGGNCMVYHGGVFLNKWLHLEGRNGHGEIWALEHACQRLPHMYSFHVLSILRFFSCMERVYFLRQSVLKV